MDLNLTITKEDYQNQKPFSYAFQDNFLESSFALTCQEEILQLPENAWDRYENPFESKFTLRDKYAFPEHCKKLFEIFESEGFISQLSKICGYKLLKDPTRNFWGIHKYKQGDKLDIHVDAGLHPTTKQKKQVTLGLYLSKFWKEEYGCQLEIWSGENAVSNTAKLFHKVESIAPMFNRLILFTCNDVSWHGNPEPATCPDEAYRIFVTISYLSENYDDLNKRQKAFFVARPSDPVDEQKDMMRLLRADPEKYRDVYRT